MKDLKYRGFYIYDGNDGEFLAFRNRFHYPLENSECLVVNTIDHCAKIKKYPNYDKYADFIIPRRVIEKLVEVSICDYYKFCFSKIDAMNERIREMMRHPDECIIFEHMDVKFGVLSTQYRYIIENEGNPDFAPFLYRSLDKKE